MPSWSRSTVGWHVFDVPAGVASVSIDLRGAGGGGGLGGRGGRVTGNLAVNGNQKLYVLVGQGGTQGTGARTGGGGPAGQGNFEADGFSGGGASFIRINSTFGTIKAIAAGGGGQSGDNGRGGAGGGAIGESGFRGTSGGNATANATGGTTTQGGNGGTSSSGSQFNGDNARDVTLAVGGAGGGAPAGTRCHGGGGGGSGYRAGGGGQAASSGFAPGGGGGGGSNFSSQLSKSASIRGGGAGPGGHGFIAISWTTPPPANQHPSPPTEAKINNVAVTNAMATKSTGSLTFTAKIDDPDSTDRVRLLVRISKNSNMSNHVDRYSAYGGQGRVHTVNWHGLEQNTRYYVRMYTQDSKGAYSLSYNSFNFWTNRKPVATPVAPAENLSVTALDSITFKWDFTDPDPGDKHTGFRISYRNLGSANSPTGPWQVFSRPNWTTFCGLPEPGNRFCYTFNPGSFRGNSFYEWKVQVSDTQGLWGDYSEVSSFFVSSASSPPVLTFPTRSEALDVGVEQTFRWRFVDPDPGDEQTRADLRYRVAGTEDWFVLNGDPSGDQFRVFQPHTFNAGYRYEWQARTYDTLGGGVSDWSESQFFWTVASPGSAVVDDPVVLIPSVQGSLGCGTHRVFVYAQGGTRLVGEISDLVRVRYSRLRDDISNALITTNGFGPDCGQMLGDLRCWMHEIVIFRDGVRVWEGPITRLTYTTGAVDIEAKDCMAYVYRRIMRQGYNDANRIIDNQQVGLTTVVRRAERIILNALAPHDPNLIPYLTAIHFDDDARQSRVVHDYSRTAWEEVDDLAATAGLDYTTVGRRIILWDTHQAIGVLPEMRDGDFSDPPIVSEYGMSLANYFAVTNGSGVWGSAERSFPEFYGPIEQLASAYGEASGGTAEVLTPDARRQLVEALGEQADRNISNRWPSPVIVRVPDNSTLNPEVGVGINQLIPGVHIPLRAMGTVRNVAQMQKLDSITVSETDEGETVSVVMSPAPHLLDETDDGIEEEV